MPPLPSRAKDTKSRRRWTRINTPRTYKRAIARIDAFLPGVTDAIERFRLERARQVFLEWDGQYEEGLANARRLLSDPQLDDERRQWLLGREAFNLVHSGKLDEYLSRWAQRVC